MSDEPNAPITREEFYAELGRAKLSASVAGHVGELTARVADLERRVGREPGTSGAPGGPEAPVSDATT